MVGLNGIVIKSHGGTDAFGFQRAIEVAVLEARNGYRHSSRSGCTHRAELEGIRCTHESPAPAAICRKKY